MSYRDWLGQLVLWLLVGGWESDSLLHGNGVGLELGLIAFLGVVLIAVFRTSKAHSDELVPLHLLKPKHVCYNLSRF